MTMFLTSWRTFHIFLNPRQTFFWSHDVSLTCFINCLTSWQNFFGVMMCFDVMTYFWHHEELFDVMTCFWRHEMFLTSWVLQTFWHPWRVFYVMTNFHDVFLRHDKLFWCPDELLMSGHIFDIMTCYWLFWRHGIFLTSCHVLDVMTCFCRHDKLFDDMTCFWRHDIFSVLFDDVTYIMKSWN